MSLTTAEVLERAMALSPAERVEVGTRLLRSAGTEDADRLVALREDVATGLQQIDAGLGTEVSPGEFGTFVHGLGDQAAERAARRSA